MRPRYGGSTVYISPEFRYISFKWLDTLTWSYNNSHNINEKTQTTNNNNNNSNSNDKLFLEYIFRQSAVMSIALQFGHYSRFQVQGFCKFGYND